METKPVAPLARVFKLARVFETLLRHYTLCNRELRAGRDDAGLTLRRRVQAYVEETFSLFGIEVERVGAPLGSPCVFVGNHWSYLDIVVLVGSTRGVFLSKAEIARWPLIGRCGRLIGTLFVDRVSRDDRKKATASAAAAVAKHGQSVIIFPEGTTSIEGKEWRMGAFRIAQSAGVPVQPFRLLYAPVRDCAFIDDDYLVPHIWRLLRHRRVRVRLEFGAPIEIADAGEEAAMAAKTKAEAWVKEGVRGWLAEHGHAESSASAPQRALTAGAH